MKKPQLPLLPNSSIVIVGGGQLGKMMSIAAANIGFKTYILTDKPDSCATQAAYKQISLQEFNDLNQKGEFDILTWETENIDLEYAKKISANLLANPSIKALSIFQNRQAEKNFLEKLNIKNCKHIYLESQNSPESILENISKNNMLFPLIAKSTESGYDGKNQWLLENESQLQSLHINSPTIIEEFMLNMKYECSQIAARSMQGQIEFFPLTVNKHIDGILTTSTNQTSDIPNEIKQSAQAITATIMNDLNYVGLIAVEFLCNDKQELVVNEIAPRPHNSGHWTLDGCNTDQFEQHIRAISGLPLSKIHTINNITMQNLLGEQSQVIQNYFKQDNAKVYLYNKDPSSPRRKIGHVNIIEDM